MDNYHDRIDSVLDSETAKRNESDNRFILATEFCKQPTESNSLIRGILDSDSLSVWFGDSEAGKSLLALDRALHIAYGLKWRGKKTKQGFFLYLIGEGKQGMVKRHKAWHEYHGLPIRDEIAFSVVPAELCQPESVNRLVDDVKRLIDKLKKCPVAIELDTLNRHFGQGDENSTRDMTAFVRGMDALRKATQAAVSTIHHCSIADKDRGRGSIVLHNSVDFEFKVTKEGESFNEWITKLELTKIKDYEKPQPFAWKWQRQSLPWTELDDDDIPVPLSSVVMVPTEFVDSEVGDKQQAALHALKTLFMQQQQNLIAAGHSPDNAKVTMGDWMDAMIKIDPYKGNRSRTRDKLIKRGLVVVDEGGYVKPA